MRRPDEMEDLVEETRKRRGKGKKPADDLRVKFFRAGIFNPEEQKRFKLRIALSMFAFSAGTIFLSIYFERMSPALRMSLPILGIFTGYALPFSILERKMRLREEDITYFLPLVIEEIVIGVSSGLDIWPCITNLMDITRERDAMNPVIELLVQAERLVRSGVGVAESLKEVGEKSGILIIKHSFSFLAQVVVHGGDVTKNLQDLAEATMVKHSTDVEGRISSLPVKATGPLCCVFAGFFALMLSGLFVQMLGAFSAQKHDPGDTTTVSPGQ